MNRTITSKIDRSAYYLEIRSTDSEPATLDGYYLQQVEVPFEVYKTVQLMEERIKEIEEQLAKENPIIHYQPNDTGVAACGVGMGLEPKEPMAFDPRHANCPKCMATKIYRKVMK